MKTKYIRVEVPYEMNVGDKITLGELQDILFGALPVLEVSPEAGVTVTLKKAYQRLADAEELYPPTHPEVQKRRLTVNLLRPIK